jgi:hypothetical protein
MASLRMSNCSVYKAKTPAAWPGFLNNDLPLLLYWKVIV